jgi:hypothetical protein
MTATLTPRNQVRAASDAPPVVEGDHPPEVEAEQRRWVIPLVLCFTWAAAFFAAAVGSGRLWLLGPAGLGIGLIIVGFVYLGLTSDTNASR